MADLNIVRADDLEITDEDLKETQKAMDFIREERKKCLIKYFNPNLYVSKSLSKQPFAMTIFWSLARDCIIDMKDGKVFILWRVKDYRHAPRLLFFKQDNQKEEYIFTIRYFLGVGERNKKEIWATKKIKCSFAEYNEFIKVYEKEIKYLGQKYSTTYKC